MESIRGSIEFSRELTLVAQALDWVARASFSATRRR